MHAFLASTAALSAAHGEDCFVHHSRGLASGVGRLGAVERTLRPRRGSAVSLGGGSAPAEGRPTGLPSMNSL